MDRSRLDAYSPKRLPGVSFHDIVGCPQVGALLRRDQVIRHRANPARVRRSSDLVPAAPTADALSRGLGESFPGSGSRAQTPKLGARFPVPGSCRMEKLYARAARQRRTGAASGHPRKSSPSGREVAFRRNRGRCA